jgi:hypothetical protein
MCILFIFCTHYFDVNSQGNCNPTLLFYSFGLFLHISASAVHSRTSTYIMYYFINVINILYIFIGVFSLRMILQESKHVGAIKF